MPDVPPTLSFEEKLKQLRREKLKPLLHDSEIARAVEDCRPRELYRLLLKKRKTCRLADRPLIDTILSSRRLFAEKVGRAPTLFTINGVGSKLYGKQEVDPGDGSYVATLYAVLLYIPLYPLAQYWVHPAGGRRWSFLGKVPLNKAALLWRRIAAGAAIVAACAVAICVLYTKTFTKLYLVNGLDIPVTVAVDSAQPVQVPGNSQRAVSNVRHGRHHLATHTVGGEPVEELDVDVPLAKDVIAYNVIGAAPLMSEGVQYFAQGHPPSEPGHLPRNEQRNYCGQRFIVCDNVQDVFVSPPAQIKMESATVIRWTFNRDHGGWVKTLRILSYEEKRDQATALAEQIARIEPENEQAVWYGIEYARLERGMTQAMDLAKSLTERSPQSLPAHRAYQTMLMAEGRTEECRITYRKLAADHPDSARFAYLRARVELPADAVKLYADLVAHTPDDPYFQRGYAWALFENRRFAEALAHFEKFETLDPKEAQALLSEHALALVALGRTADAIELVGSICGTQLRQGSLEPYLLLEYGRLARLDSTAASRHPPETMLKLWASQDPLTPTTKAWFVYQTDPLGLDEHLLQALTNINLRTAADLTLSSSRSPDAALRRLPTVPDEVLTNLDDAVLVLLAGESQRRGDFPLATRLLANVKNVTHGLAALKTNVLTGVELPEIAELDLRMQAALELIAARRANVDEKQARELRTRAQRDDLLQGFVTAAAKNWPN